MKYTVQDIPSTANSAFFKVCERDANVDYIRRKEIVKVNRKSISRSIMKYTKVQQAKE